MKIETLLQPKFDAAIEMRILEVLVLRYSTSPEKCQYILSSVSSEDFYDIKGRSAFDFIKMRASKGLPFDLVSLLQVMPEPGSSLLAGLAVNDYSSILTVDHDVSRLKSLAIVRAQMNVVNDLCWALHQETDPDEARLLISTAASKLSEGGDQVSASGNYYEDIIDEVLAQENEEDEYLQTNLVDWPVFPARGMITVGGRSGCGKTFMGIHLMEAILQVKPQTRAIYFNLEMQKTVMLKRHLNMIKPFKGSLRQGLLQGGAELLLTRDVRLESKSSASIEEIEFISKAEALKTPISVIVVDYVGRVRSKIKGERYIQLEDIAQRLASLALDLKCHVIALQQVNRAPSNRPKNDRMPYPSDAAGSVGFERSSEWWLAIDQPQIDSPDIPAFEDMFAIQTRKQRGEGGYFSVYYEFKDGRFHKTNQESARVRLSGPVSGTRKAKYQPK